MEYIINLVWDKEASVWIATSDDVDGLVLESGSLDALIERVKYAVPELLELNKPSGNLKTIIHFKSDRVEEVTV